MEQYPSIIEQYKSILKAIKDITKADDCSLFLLDNELGMDLDEKKEVFKIQAKRIGKSVGSREKHDFEKKIEELVDTDTLDTFKEYSILTYFVGTQEHWRLPDYKTRPQKYVVFNWNDEKNTPIINEGLTAFTARTRKSVVYKKDPSFAGINEGESNIHNHCCQVTIVPLFNQDNKVFGVIRCDIYRITNDILFSHAETVRQLEQLNTVLYNILKLGKDTEADHIYITTS